MDFTLALKFHLRSSPKVPPSLFLPPRPKPASLTWHHPPDIPTLLFRPLAPALPPATCPPGWCPHPVNGLWWVAHQVAPATSHRPCLRRHALSPVRCTMASRSYPCSRTHKAAVPQAGVLCTLCVLSKAHNAPPPNTHQHLILSHHPLSCQCYHTGSPQVLPLAQAVSYT